MDGGRARFPFVLSQNGGTRRSGRLPSNSGSSRRTSAMTLSGWFSKYGSPSPVTPSSVWMRSQTQLGGTFRISSRVIFIITS